jgi:hypothetical protein
MLLDFLTLSSKTTHLLVVAQRKMYDHEFCVPFQEQYETMVPDEARARYAMVVDGEVMDGNRVKYLTKDAILAKEYLTEIQGLKNWIDAYRGQIDGLKHELAVTKHLLEHAALGNQYFTPVLGPLDRATGRELARELVRRVRRRLPILQHR